MLILLLNRIFLSSIFLIFIFGFSLFSLFKFIIFLSFIQFFKLNTISYNYIISFFNENYFDTYYYFLNKYVNVELKNKICFEGKLIHIKKSKIHFYNVENVHLIFIITIKKNIHIHYTLNIDKIKTIKLSKNNIYDELLDDLFKKSIFFKNIDIHLKKSIKDFLYINNND